MAKCGKLSDPDSWALAVLRFLVSLFFLYWFWVYKYVCVYMIILTWKQANLNDWP